MWSEFPLFPEQASTIAGGVDALYYFLSIVAAFFSVLIFLLIFYFAVRYRRRPSNAGPVQFEGHLGIEMLWTVVPLLLTLVMFGWGAVLFVENSHIPEDAQDIYVVGQQWMWKVQHPEGRREINELHVPVGQPIKFTLASQDVIHSFYIPAFRVKQDVVPGRYTTMWFEATKPGEYHLFCAEYCGTQHSGMIGRVVVMGPDDYQRWLEGTPQAPDPEPVRGPARDRTTQRQDVERTVTAYVESQAPQTQASVLDPDVVQAGQQLFVQRGCQACHVAGAPYPQLAGKFGIVVPLEGGGAALFDEDYIRESLVMPNVKVSAGFKSIMPTYATSLNEEEILQIILYLRSLRPTEGQR